MSISETYSAIGEFFTELEPFAVAYTHKTFRYAAIRNKGKLELIQALLLLDIEKRFEVPRLYETEDIVCEDIALEYLGLTPPELVEALLTGSVVTSKGVLLFAASNPGSSYSLHHAAFDGSTADERGFASQLQIVGANDAWQFVQPTRIRRQVKTGSPPYDDLNHLGSDFGLVLNGTWGRTFQIFASRIAQISNTSSVRGKRADIEVCLPKVLARSGVKLGFQIAAPETTVTRISKTTDEIIWTEDSDLWRGHVALDVELDSKVNCSLSYASIPQHDRELDDPDREVNSLRVAYEVFDAKAIFLKQAIDNRKIRDLNPLDLELTVGALLAIRGFRVIHLDQLPKLGDSPDILASDPVGNILVVECTTDAPKVADKLSKLLRRFRAVRFALADKNRDDIGVVPVLAIAQFRADIAFLLKRAADHGVVVWAAEDLEELRGFEGRPDPVEFFQKLSQTRVYLQQAAIDGDPSDEFG